MQNCQLNTPDESSDAMINISPMLDPKQYNRVRNVNNLPCSDDDMENIESSWLPSDKTKETLSNVKLGDRRVFYTMPGIRNVDIAAVDISWNPLVKKYCPEYALDSVITSPISLDHGDIVQTLLRHWAKKKFRDVINQTAEWLTKHGQGVGCAYQKHSLNTPLSFKVWCLRLQSFMQLGLYSEAYHEIEPFGDMDAPDLYYDYYPDIYQLKKGSMIPFELRLLHANLPRMMNKPGESLIRISNIIGIVKKLIPMSPSTVYQHFWTCMLIEAKKCLASCFMALKDYRLALDTCALIMKLYENTMIGESQTKNRALLLSTMVRLCLQLGDSKGAAHFQQKVASLLDSIKTENTTYVTEFSDILSTNDGLMHVFNNNYLDASKCFIKVLETSADSVQAVNNAAVCLLYLGKLNDAIDIMEKFMHRQPSVLCDDESFYANLCALYELLSAPNCSTKKINLLQLVAANGLENFNASRLKLPL